MHTFERDEIMIKHTQNVQLEKGKSSIRSGLAQWVFWHSSADCVASCRVPGNSLTFSDLLQRCIGYVENEDTLAHFSQNGLLKGILRLVNFSPFFLTFVYI